jgi:protein-S-isoprenylcysteine O-methyltransferase Ste14
MIGFLLQWPTVLTVIMFPILVWMYVPLAHREERDTEAEFGQAYEQYAALVPAFVSRLHSALPELAEVQQSSKAMRKAANQ